MSYARRPNNTDVMISLKVDNLTYRTTPDMLKRVFEKYGEVGDVYIPRDPYNQESRGFAFVRFYDERDADDAIDAMDGATLDGRELRVQHARYGRPREERREERRDDRRRAPAHSGPRGRRHSRSRSRSGSNSRSHRRRRSSRSNSRNRDRHSANRERSLSQSPSRGHGGPGVRGRAHSPDFDEHGRSRSRSRSNN